MKQRLALISSIIAGCALAFAVQAAPPEGKGKGPDASAGHPGKGNSGNSGNPGKGNPGKGNSGNSGNNGGSRNGEGSRAYDDRGRYAGYFDDHRDSRGRLRNGDGFDGLLYAGITAALAREYALDYGLGGYSSLPPGIRKNLARGKPLPPGIAKKVVPVPLLGRLPRHPGYEWRIAGSDLILISVATAVVADILYDVFD